MGTIYTVSSALEGFLDLGHVDIVMVKTTSIIKFYNINLVHYINDITLNVHFTNQIKLCSLLLDHPVNDSV